MAFQDVSTPRFYVNHLEWILSNYRTGTPTLVYEDDLGTETVLENSELMKHTSLSNRSAISITPPNNTLRAIIKYPLIARQGLIDTWLLDDLINGNSPIFQGVNYAYILGHNLESQGVTCILNLRGSGDHPNHPWYDNTFRGNDPIDNHTILSHDEEYSQGVDDNWIPEYNGYSIVGLGTGKFVQRSDDEYAGYISNHYIREIQLIFQRKSNAGVHTFSGDKSFEFSSFGFGKYFDMMHSPELDLTYSKSYDGVQKQKSIGGATLVNYNYLQPPAFGNFGYFELSKYSDTSSGWSVYRGLNKPSRTGRRNYQLNFKYLENSTTKDSLFPQSESLHRFEEGTNAEGNPTNTFTKNNTLYDDNSFYGNVIHMTQGGTIPFIFQADNSNFSGDQFSVCTFDQKDFNFKQVAPSVYDCSLKIVESW